MYKGKNIEIKEYRETFFSTFFIRIVAIFFCAYGFNIPRFMGISIFCSHAARAKAVSLLYIGEYNIRAFPYRPQMYHQIKKPVILSIVPAAMKVFLNSFICSFFLKKKVVFVWTVSLFFNNIQILRFIFWEKGGLRNSTWLREMIRGRNVERLTRGKTSKRTWKSENADTTFYKFSRYSSGILIRNCTSSNYDFDRFLQPFFVNGYFPWNW